MQHVGVIPLQIDFCQNHVLEGGKVRRHYLLYEYWEQKMDAWKRLSEYLDLVLTTKNDHELQDQKTALAS